VLDPLGIGRQGLRVEAEEPPLDVHTALAVALELLAHRGVVQPGINGGHLRAGMAQEALDDVLGHALVHQSGNAAYLP